MQNKLRKLEDDLHDFMIDQKNLKDKQMKIRERARSLGWRADFITGNLIKK